MKKMRGPIGPLTAAQLARFESKVERVTESGCWIWMAASNEKGYGVFGMGPRESGTRLAHRVSYEHHRGEIPPGLELDHLCRVPCCVNPWHLEPVTSKVNSRRGLWGALKTHCIKGHPLSGDNLVQCLVPRGIRRCRACELVRHKHAWHTKYSPKAKTA